MKIKSHWITVRSHQIAGHNPYFRLQQDILKKQFFSRQENAKAVEQRWSRGHKAQGQGHKKIRGQGQGQPFRGQTLSSPRTGMLEAKDQGHSRKCSPKKKGLQKSFSGNL